MNFKMLSPVEPLRGLYFLRFPLALWVMVLILTPLDMTPAASVLRGILTSETWPQAASAAFMIFSTGSIILLLIRVIAINGQERFERNHWLFNLFGGGHFGNNPDRGKALPAYAFPFAHAPGLILLGRVFHDTVAEHGLSSLHAALSLVAGVLLAYLFWLVVGLVYYWTFDAQGIPNAPHELIFPRWLTPLTRNAAHEIHQSPKPVLADWLDSLVFQHLAQFGRGFSNDQKTLYEGHRITFIAFAGLALLYFFLFNFTSPVPIPYAELVCNTVTLIVLALFLAGCQMPRGAAIARAPRVVQIIVVILLLAVMCLTATLWLHHIRATRGFSVLGSVLILVTGVFWLLATIAFFADNSRLPIFSVSLILILGLKLLPWYHAEHFLTVFTSDAPLADAPTPGQILAARLGQALEAPDGKLRPLIVVTAQGGGIHSAAWTANVLSELEAQFTLADPSHPFHARVLLASGVSGGSFGIMPFLREYTAPHPFENLDESKNRVIHAASCSSLQAIAWGLTYNDMLNFLSPIPHLPLPTASGIAPAGQPSEGFDRSWALERSFNRNLSDPECEYSDSALTAGNKQLEDGYQLTLATTSALLRDRSFPAFTFNTTAAETGSRFLLSNYELGDPPTPKPPVATDLLPAETFLHTFAHASVPIAHQFADLPLATAARLSGTFPFVSSASRVPTVVSPNGAYHFIDGGYYDNDGTASAMEFLWFARTQLSNLHTQLDAATPAPIARLPILFIEIRNGPDLPATESLDSFSQQNRLDKNGKKRASWGAVNQLLSPVIGLYTAGNGSQTLRDRHELCVLETAQEKDFYIHHMVFDYRNPDDINQPLSWHLTREQQKTIACAIDPDDSECRTAKIEGLDKDKSPNRTIRNLAVEAAHWNPTRQELAASPNPKVCNNTGLGPALQ